MAQQAGETGLQWLEELKDTIGSLSELPHRCSLAPENVAFPFEVRQIHGRKPHQYRVLFTIEADIVIVLHVRHGRPFPVAGH